MHLSLIEVKVLFFRNRSVNIAHTSLVFVFRLITLADHCIATTVNHYQPHTVYNYKYRQTTAENSLRDSFLGEVLIVLYMFVYASEKILNEIRLSI